MDKTLIDRVRVMYREGRSMKTVAAALGLPHSVVRRILKNAGVASHPKGKVWTGARNDAKDSDFAIVRFAATAHSTGACGAVMPTGGFCGAATRSTYCAEHAGGMRLPTPKLSPQPAPWMLR